MGRDMGRDMGQRIILFTLLLNIRGIMIYLRSPAVLNTVVMTTSMCLTTEQYHSTVVDTGEISGVMSLTTEQ